MLDPVALLNMKDVEVQVYVSVLNTLQTSAASASTLAVLEWNLCKWESSCNRIVADLRRVLQQTSRKYVRRCT